ncbi:response regulator [Paenibacillus terrigena]|uniref:response regulator n=1 Tax=Paenibacillus terrigena TaxID=369333 RepID=UPI00036E3E8B|nr:response regulator [Paenibacillus terrigena]
MMNVMIVEDETIMRLALTTLIDWESNGFRIVYEASNGYQALEYIKENREIDIMITDLKMPVMDGLELIDELNQLNGTSPHVVILSAYDDFEFVRKAFKRGVQDYILKSEMDPNIVLDLFNRIKHDCEVKQNMSRKSIEIRNGERMRLKQQTIREWLEIGVNSQFDPFVLEDLKMRLEWTHITVSMIRVEGFAEVQERYGSAIGDFVSSVLKSIDQVLAEAGTGEVISWNTYEYVVLLSFATNSLMYVRQSISQIMDQIIFVLKEYINIQVTIGVSELCEELKQIPAFYLQARKNADLRFVINKHRVIYPEDANHFLKQSGESLIGKEQALLDALKEREEQAVLQELDHMFALIKRSASMGNEVLRARYMELLMILVKFMYDNEFVNSLEMDKIEDVYRMAWQVDSADSLQDSISNFVLQLLQESDKKAGQMNRVVAIAQAYIMEHYREEITLGKVSEMVHLSESHFSTLFSKAVGETFKEFVTKVRMEKAMESMKKEPYLKIYEIAERTGYASTEHFSRVFKKATGISPNQFIRSVAK